VRRRNRYRSVGTITQAFGLATTLGQCPSVGIGGLTTGGGFGWLTGRHGLSCDNLVAAQVFTAQGRKLRAAADENEDLFWALRGGGGNYGVAVEFEYRLHPVSQVIGGMLCYPLSQFRAGFAFMREFLRRPPDELAASFGIRPVDGNSAFAIALCWCGKESDAEAVLEPLRSFATPSGGSIGPLPYLQMQKVTGESSAGRCLYNRGGFMRELSDEAIDTIAQNAAHNASRTNCCGWTIIMERCAAWRRARRPFRCARPASAF
jgi:FAD binding domain